MGFTYFRFIKINYLVVIINILLIDIFFILKTIKTSSTKTQLGKEFQFYDIVNFDFIRTLI